MMWLPMNEDAIKEPVSQHKNSIGFFIPFDVEVDHISSRTDNEPYIRT